MAVPTRRLPTDDEPSVTPAVGQAPGRSQFNLSSGAATAVVFVSIVLCFILLCTYCRCARRRAVAGARRSVMRRLREHVPGMTRPAGAQLPAVRYASTVPGAGGKKGQHPRPPEDCPVCLEAFDEDDLVKVVPPCGHVFHAPCIDRWLDARCSCPVCRCAVVCCDHAGEAGNDGSGRGGQEIVLERVVAMVEAMREGQREEAAAAPRQPP